LGNCVAANPIDSRRNEGDMIYALEMAIACAIGSVATFVEGEMGAITPNESDFQSKHTNNKAMGIATLHDLLTCSRSSSIHRLEQLHLNLFIVS
jgi:hypothetical protein